MRLVERLRQLNELVSHRLDVSHLDLLPTRRLRTGADRQGNSTDITAHLRATGREICADDQALEWFYGGGPLPQ